MRKTQLLLRGMATVAALTLVLAACSSSDDGSSTSPTGATSGTEAPSPTEASTPTAVEGSTVTVTIGETDVQHMYMNLDPATVAGGTVTFTIVNEGVKKHEFVILSTDVLAADLKVVGDEVVEDDYTAIDEVEDLAGGDTATLTVELAPGHYALICNLKGHFRMGMYADLTVE